MKRKSKKSRKHRNAKSTERSSGTRRKKQTKRHFAPASKKARLSTPRNQREALARERVLAALGRMRREKRSMADATRLEHTKESTFLRYAGSAVHRAGPGKPWKPNKSDRLSARMTVLTPQGPITALVRGSRERSRLGRYDIALRKWRLGEPGAEAELLAFRGQTVGGYRLITDVKLLATLEDADALDFESLYSSLAGGV
jgi:hypothetical protein